MIFLYFAGLEEEPAFVFIGLVLENEEDYGWKDNKNDFDAVFEGALLL